MAKLFRADGDGCEARPVPEPVYIAVDDLQATCFVSRESVFTGKR